LSNEDRPFIARPVQLRLLRTPVDDTIQQPAVHSVGDVVAPAHQVMIILAADSHLASSHAPESTELEHVRYYGQTRSARNGSGRCGFDPERGLRLTKNGCCGSWTKIQRR
jgi:hypothetical protein